MDLPPQESVDVAERASERDPSQAQIRSQTSLPLLLRSGPQGAGCRRKREKRTGPVTTAPVPLVQVPYRLVTLLFWAEALGAHASTRASTREKLLASSVGSLSMLLGSTLVSLGA